MKTALGLLVLFLVACSPVPAFKPAGSVSFTASASAFGRANVDARIDPLSAPMIVLTNAAPPSCGEPDAVALPSAADAVLVINLYDSAGDAGFQPITPGDYAVSGGSGRVATANYYERCTEQPFSFDALCGTVTVTRVDAETSTFEGTYSFTFGGTSGFSKEKITGSFGTTHCGDYDSELKWGTCH